MASPQPLAPPIHGTALSINGHAVLLLGPSGAGKSDLALRLIERGYAGLIADDQVIPSQEDGRVFVSAPTELSGLLEVRGLGLVEMPSVPAAALLLAVRLVPSTPPGSGLPRLPESEFWSLDHHSKGPVHVPLIHLDPFEASAVEKVMLAVRARCRVAQSL